MSRIVIIETQQSARGSDEHATLPIHGKKLVIGSDFQFAARQRHSVETRAIESRQAHLTAHPNSSIGIERQLIHHFGQQPFIASIGRDIGAVEP